MDGMERTPEELTQAAAWATFLHQLREELARMVDTHGSVNGPTSVAHSLIDYASRCAYGVLTGRDDYTRHNAVELVGICATL